MLIFQVIDISTGRHLGPNQEGELCVKTDYLMLGYLNNTEATARTLDADGWLHTGAQRNTLDSEIASAFHETYVVTLFVDVKVDYSY